MTERKLRMTEPKLLPEDVRKNKSLSSFRNKIAVTSIVNNVPANLAQNFLIYAFYFPSFTSSFSSLYFDVNSSANFLSLSCTRPSRKSAYADGVNVYK